MSTDFTPKKLKIPFIKRSNMYLSRQDTDDDDDYLIIKPSQQNSFNTNRQKALNRDLDNSLSSADGSTDYF